MVICMKKNRFSGLLLAAGLSLAVFTMPASAEVKVVGNEATDTTTYTTVESAGESLRNLMAKRYDKITINVDYDLFDTAKAFYYQAQKYPGTGRGLGSYGDYLEKALRSVTMKPSFNDDGNVRILFTVSYYTNGSMESSVNSKVDEVLPALTSGKDEKGKVKAIYDWIVDRVVYHDAEAQSSTITYPTAYSAYGAAIENKAVCQGYATLFYKMCTEAGLGCRIVDGTAQGSRGKEDHAWNIVKVGGSWYNVDVTWDANYKQKKDYHYFLLSNNDFPNHWRSSKYTSAEWNRDHPMASSSLGTPPSAYNTSSNNKNNDTASGTVKSNGSATVGGSSAVNNNAYKSSGEVIVRITPGTYRPRSISKNLYLMVKKNSKKNKAPLALGKKNQKTAKFKITKASGDYYYVMNTKTKKYMGLKSKTVVQTKKDNSSTLWKVVKCGDNYKFENSNGKCMYVKSAGSLQIGDGDSLEFQFGF